MARPEGQYEITNVFYTAVMGRVTVGSWFKYFPKHVPMPDVRPLNSDIPIAFGAIRLYEHICEVYDVGNDRHITDGGVLGMHGMLALLEWDCEYNDCVYKRPGGAIGFVY